MHSKRSRDKFTMDDVNQWLIRPRSLALVQLTRTLKDPLERPGKAPKPLRPGTSVLWIAWGLEPRGPVFGGVFVHGQGDGNWDRTNGKHLLVGSSLNCNPEVGKKTRRDGRLGGRETQVPRTSKEYTFEIDCFWNLETGLIFPFSIFTFLLISSVLTNRWVRVQGALSLVVS